MDEKLLSELYRLNDEIEKLQTEKKEVEQKIIQMMENERIESYQYLGKATSIARKCSYSYNIALIYGVLAPRELFPRVIRIDKKQLDKVLQTPGLLAEEETEKILEAVKIKDVKQYLRVR